MTTEGISFKPKRGKWRSIRENVTLNYHFLNCLHIKIILRISRYATVSTDESVYVIGGYTGNPNEDGYVPPMKSSVIAEYRDGSWNNIGNFVQGRDYHSAILLGSSIMIVGGIRESGRCDRCT